MYCNSSLQEELEGNMMTVLYLLVLVTKLVPALNKDDLFRVQRLVFQLNRLRLALRDGQTLLHLAVNAETPVDDFHTNDVCRYTYTASRMSSQTLISQTRLVAPLLSIIHELIVGSCRFPSHEAALLLIQCGADVNAMDTERNTPLHVIVSYQKPIRYI